MYRSDGAKLNASSPVPSSGVWVSQCLCREKHNDIVSIVLLELKKRTESNFTDKEKKVITTDKSGKILIFLLKV